MLGYDLDLIKEISSNVSIPVVALGGAGKLEDLVCAVNNGHASAVSAGSLFVYHGPRNAVLINGITSIAVMKLDVLDKFKSIKIAIGYKLPNGEIRKVSCKTEKSELYLVKDAIEVLTTLEFNKIKE